MKRTAALLASMLTVLVLAVPSIAGKDDAAEPKLKAQAASEIAKYVQWCADNGAKT